MDKLKTYAAKPLPGNSTIEWLYPQYLETSSNRRMIVKKSLIGILLFFFSNAFAHSESTVVRCHADSPKLPGSYIGQRSTPEFSSNRIDQLQLHEDGSAYWNQSYAINFPISNGTYTPGIGS